MGLMDNRVAIVLPVRNSEKMLEKSVRKLRAFLGSNNMDACEIVIADSNSTDATPRIGRRLAEDAGIGYVFTPRTGKGAAIRRAWLSLKDEFRIFVFMDVDMATDLSALPELIGAIAAGGDVASGSRYLRASRIRRGLVREAISKTYRMLFGLAFRTGISDPQCGFKAVSQPVIEHVLPQIVSEGFFFDTELLVRAVGAGYSIKEIPIIWTEYPGSSVRLLRDIPEFLIGLVQLKFRQMHPR
jgi:glycosyltransferase involved in cell wall biosynthesis